MSIERIEELVPAAGSLPQTAGTRYLAAEQMNQRGFNPISKLMDLAERLENHEESDCGGIPVHADKLFKIYMTLAKFYAPQPKSLDVSVKADNTITIQAVDYTGLIQSRQEYIPQALQYQGPQLIGVTEPVEEDEDGAG